MFGSSPAGPSKEREGGVNQRTRFERSRSEGFWSTFKKRCTPGTHPSTTSQSNHDSAFNTETDIVFLETNGHLQLELLDPIAAHSRNKKKSSGGGGGLIKNRRGDAKRKSSAGVSGSRFGDEDEMNSGGPVSAVVVENDFDKFKPSLAKSDSGSTRTPGGRSGNERTSTKGGLAGHPSLFGKSDEVGGSDIGEEGDGNGRRGSGIDDLDNTSMKSRRPYGPNWFQRTRTYEIFTERLWPNFKHFLDSSYTEPAKERSFIKEAWFQQKATAMAASVFFFVSWALTTGLQSSYPAFTIITYCALAGAFTAPLFFLIVFDAPRRRNWIYQPILFGATWILADSLIIDAHICGFFTTDNQCGTKSFLNIMGSAYAQPVLSLLMMRQNRTFAILGAIQWMILTGVLLMSQDSSPTLFYRNMVNFILFHAFIIGASFLKEKSDRAMFAMRQQLKMQYRATQSAQVMERKASDSKKRFVSYIFHEVRVPLNTALLAVQNLEGEHVFKQVPDDQAEMVHGLMRSLTTMEKVLNDVLSFNRMEAGKFTQARKPFEFHKAIGLVALSHRAQAQASGIDLIVELDQGIDKIGGVFMGDEMRLRQITSNLVSNSIKFTEKGSVRIVTKLLYPRLEPTPASELDDPLREAAMNLKRQQEMEEATRRQSVDHHERDKISSPRLNGGDLEKGSVHLESVRHSGDWDSKRPMSHPGSIGGIGAERVEPKAVIRVEIHDTGVGLKKEDLEDQRLFSPYVQTEIGRRQGGKGSGLGLALVRQIVRLSSGRLGVDSEYGKGSTFWFELPYAFPPTPKPRSRESTASNGLFSQPLSLGQSIPRSPPLGNGLMGRISAIGEAEEDPMSQDRDREVRSHDYAHGGAALGESREIGEIGHEGRSRPQISETESTAPLLTRGPTQPKLTSLRPSYPPPSSSSSGSASSYRTDLDIQQMMGEAPTITSPYSPPMTIMGQSPLSFAGTQMNDPERRDSEFTLGSAGSRRTSEIVSPSGTATAPAAAPGTGSGDGEGALCTLVVDDDKLTRMLMSRMLARLGHTVHTAENGKIALDMIRDSFEGNGDQPKFDVCFLDNQMPLMSGVEVAREVRLMGNDLFVVGCTGNAMREDQDSYLAAGADAIITKPIHQRAILEQIKEARKRIRGETKPRPVLPFD